MPLEAGKRTQPLDTFFLNELPAEAILRINRAVGAPAGNGAPAFLVLKRGEKLPFVCCLIGRADGVGLSVFWCSLEREGFLGGIRECGARTWCPLLRSADRDEETVALIGERSGQQAIVESFGGVFLTRGIE